jgi:hypothetical protein
VSTRRVLPWSLAGLALAALPAVAQAPRPAPAGAATAAPASRLLRAWSDTIKVPGGGEVARRVEVVFDYARGVAVETAYDRSGRVLSRRSLDREQPRPSAEEIAEAVAVLRADPQIGRIMARTGAVPEGGFLLQERAGLACAARTRCIQVLLLSPDQRGLLRRSVVDLTKRTIPYRSYTPKENEVDK